MATASSATLRSLPRVTAHRRLRLTLSTAASLWGLYSVYLLFFSPLFSPRVDVIGDNTKNPVDIDPGRMTEERRQAEQYLPGQTWASEPKKGYHFRTDSGFFYFQDRELFDDDRKVRFKPFAMIWRPKGHDPNKPPYTVVSDSAVVEFTRKFELSNPNPGRVNGGALEGRVEIRGADGLEIDGQQFYFGEHVQRIWSDHVIRFQMGQNSGRATGIEIDLVPHPQPEAAETLAVTDIRTVRLLKSVKMKLYPTTATPEATGEPVMIDCQGAFEYEFLNYLAKFEKQVRVIQPTGPGQADQLNCETLTLVFERDEAESTPTPQTPPATAATGASAIDAKLKFRRLLAVGPEVTVRSARSDMQGWMTSLNYDEQNRIIALSDPRHVRLLQRNNEILCPEITAVLDEDKKQIEQVECRGAGQLYQYARDTDQNLPTTRKKRELSATWQRVLKKVPDVDGLDLIELTGRAELKRIGQMSLEADVIGIWVTRGNGRIDRSSIGQTAAEPEEAIQPKKLLALKDVRFASPQIGGRTDSLSVWFEEGVLPPIPVIQAGKVSRVTRRPILESTVADEDSRPLLAQTLSAPQPGSRPRSSSFTTADSRIARPGSDRYRTGPSRPGLAAVPDEPATLRNKNPRSTTAAPPGAIPKKRSEATQPEKPVGADTTAGRKPVSSKTTMGKASPKRVAPSVARRDDESPPTEEPARRRDQPLDVVAEQIQVRAMREGDKTEIAEVITEGRVHVRQEHANGEKPLEVIGDRLHLLNYGDPYQILQVYGAPAQVQDRQMQLEGPNIRFDRIANRALVTGAGVLRVPVSRGFDGKTLDQSQLLDIFWKEKLDFDGKVARFYADVHTVLNGTDLKCEEMDVTFNRRISFADDSTATQQADIQTVLCREGVKLTSFEYDHKVLTSKRMASGFEFSFNQTTGRVTATGPGRLELWRREGVARDPQQPAMRVDQMRAGEVGASAWSYTMIDFDGNMRGNSREQTTTFRDVKKIIYGPVTNAGDTFDEFKLPPNGGLMKCRELTISQIAAQNKAKSHLELKGTGNVILDGQSFNAMAHQVSFDQSKDQYILTGDGAQDATIWRESRAGARRSAQSAQYMRFVPSRNELSFDRASGGEANQ